MVRTIYCRAICTAVLLLGLILFTVTESVNAQVNIQYTDNSNYVLFSPIGYGTYGWTDSGGFHQATVQSGIQKEFAIVITPPPGCTVLDSAIDWGNYSAEGLGGQSQFFHTYDDHACSFVQVWVFFSNLQLHRKLIKLHDGFHGDNDPTLPTPGMSFSNISLFMRNIISQTTLQQVRTIKCEQGICVWDDESGSSLCDTMYVYTSEPNCDMIIQECESDDDC